MYIHTFGESHSVYGWYKCNKVITHSLGPTLAYSFGRDKLDRCDIKNFGIKNNDSVFLVLVKLIVDVIFINI